MLTVGIVYNVKVDNKGQDEKYREWDEPVTIEKIKNVLEENCRVILLEQDKTLWSKLEKYKRQLDIVFNIAEGLKGPWREAMVPVILEGMEIPYTGSDPATLILCLDKWRTKQILEYHKIRYPSGKVFIEVPELTQKELLPLEFPLIVKPLYEGSSMGIRNSSLVIDIKQCQNEIARVIQTFREPALVEEFIPGREFSVGILGNREELIVLPVVEINFSSLPKGASPIYSYEAKWIWDVPESPLNIYNCPARLTGHLERKIKKIAVDTYNALMCRDWCRIDIRLDNLDNPYILELNPIPGIMPDANSNSCLPRAAFSFGWDYPRLIGTVLSIACKRYGIQCASLELGTRGLGVEESRVQVDSQGMP